MKHKNKIALLLLLAAVGFGSAWAEKADSDKPTIIEADHGLGENVSQVRTLTGNVVLTKGTLIMKAGKAVVTEDPEGYQFVTFWAAPDTLANFRQKRDGGPDLWMEGQAERIEYNNKTEIVKLFSKAKVTQLDGKRITDEADGPFISYDSRKEVFALENTTTGESKPGGGRVKMVIQPRTLTPVAPAPAPATGGAAAAPARGGRRGGQSPTAAPSAATLPSGTLAPAPSAVPVQLPPATTPDAVPAPSPAVPGKQ
jgi:lipopolysaccharide export system protein LptA